MTQAELPTRQVDQSWFPADLAEYQEALRSSPSLAFHAAIYIWAGEQFASGRVLDVGSEYGLGSRLLAAANRKIQVFGIEREIYLMRLPAFPSSTIPVLFTCADALHLPYPNQIFSGVCLLNIIHLVSDPDKLLCEIARVICPLGKAVLTVPTDGHPDRDWNWWTGFLTDIARDYFGQVRFPRSIAIQHPWLDQLNYPLNQSASLLTVVLSQAKAIP